MDAFLAPRVPRRNRRSVRLMWEQPVRSRTSEIAPRRIAGTFCVSRGSSWLSRILSWCLRLPRSGESVPLVLVITPEGDNERWVRQFGERRLETVCRHLPQGRWLERFGLLEFEFLVRKEQNTTYQDQKRCRFVIGALSIPLPSFLSPSIEGSEEACEDGSKSVHVVVSAPFAGKLLEYSGVVQAEEDVWRSH